MMKFWEILEERYTHLSLTKETGKPHLQDFCTLHMPKNLLFTFCWKMIMKRIFSENVWLHLWYKCLAHLKTWDEKSDQIKKTLSLKYIDYISDRTNR